MKPLFSIVMPVLNAMPYLERALESVLAQAGNDTEVIVVDGGSTDGGMLAVAEQQRPLQKQGSTKRGSTRRGSTERGTTERGTTERLRLISEPDGGQSEALNKGFALAQGSYFFWVNGDDLLLPGTLDRVREYLGKHPECQWLAGNLKYIDEQERVLKCAWDGRWHDWLYRNAPVRVYGPTSIFKRELFEQVGGFDESLHYLMDTDLWLRFKAAGARFERLPHYCWAFRVHGTSKTSGDLRGRADPQMLAERELVYAKHNLRVTQLGLWRQRLWRAVNGSYFKALVDSLKAAARQQRAR